MKYYIIQDFHNLKKILFNQSCLLTSFLILTILKINFLLKPNLMIKEFKIKNNIKTFLLIIFGKAPKKSCSKLSKSALKISLKNSKSF